MDNLNRVVSYLNSVLRQNGGDMSSVHSTSSGCMSGISEDDPCNIMDKSMESVTSTSAQTYLTIPEEVMTLSSVPDLENAVEHCKTLILEMEEESDEKKWLVRRLIELRLKLFEMKDRYEASDNESNSKRVLLGHHFALQNFPTSTATHYCDRCSGMIWNVFHSWYLCVDCDYKCHVTCLDQVCRVCAHLQVCDNPKYISEICPEAERGLDDQHYRCAECLTHTAFRDGVLEPRLCDYNGKYYCPTCHWNSTSVIPARVINNWDFNKKKVCRASKQVLKLLSRLPILQLEELNPVLFASIESLSDVKESRQRLLLMKKYLTCCKAALESNLLWHLDGKLHLIETLDNYSLQDLVELRSGELLPFLDRLRATFSKHIKQECKMCYERGYYCELCQNKQVIFPFDENVMFCYECQSTYHFPCWVQNNQSCPKCKRVQMRLQASNLADVPDDLDDASIVSTNPFDS